jgi:hypothetical protein
VSPPPHVLREYALLADGERGIVVGPRGEFVWMCFPRWHSDAIFASLIGGAGTYAVTPRDRFVWGGQYEPGTLIWRGRWTTDDDAVIECRDALALPAKPDRAVILRRVIAVRGCARVRVAVAGLEDVPHAWSGEAREFDLDLPEGTHHDLVLVLGKGPLPDPDAAWAATEAHSRAPRFECRDAAHAYAVMSGLTSADGGMVAAATTSLPERAYEGRSYDYRYVWIRDQCYAGVAVAAAGPYQLLDDAVRFVTARLLEHGPDLKPAYTVTGGAVPDQHALELPGYPGGSDIIGNHVNRQFQLDVFGEALLLFAAAARHDHLDADAWRAAEIAAGAIEARWREPDAGIWELDPDRWTHSRLICAAGLRATGLKPGLADAIVDSSAAHPSGRWQRAPGDPRVDASLLLGALRGAVPVEDPRSTATLRAVADDLTQDGYCYRYKPDERPLGEAEGAFLLCGFWLALAYHQRGDHVAAARWFERNRAACGPPGLLAEEFDVTQRQLRGNLPQAFVHALLLETAVTLAS